MGVMVRDRLIF